MQHCRKWQVVDVLLSHTGALCEATPSFLPTTSTFTTPTVVVVVDLVQVVPNEQQTFHV